MGTLGNVSLRVCRYAPALPPGEAGGGDPVSGEPAHGMRPRHPDSPPLGMPRPCEWTATAGLGRPSSAPSPACAGGPHR
jgi:hypothetical protein